MNLDFTGIESRMLALIEEERKRIITSMVIPSGMLGCRMVGNQADMLIMDNPMRAPVEEATEAFQSFGRAASKIPPGLYTFTSIKKVVISHSLASLLEVLLNSSVKGTVDNPTNFTPNREYGWYRQFEKPNGKRNKKL